jgi:hypothetical protein
LSVVAGSTRRWSAGGDALVHRLQFEVEAHLHIHLAREIVATKDGAEMLAGGIEP